MSLCLCWQRPLLWRLHEGSGHLWEPKLELQVWQEPDPWFESLYCPLAGRSYYPELGVSTVGRSVELTAGPLWSLMLNLSRLYHGLAILKSALMILVVVSVTSLGLVILGKMYAS